MLTKENRDGIEQLVELSELLGVERIVFEDLRGAGRAREYWEELHLSDKEYEDVYMRLRELSSRWTGCCRIVFGSDTRFALEILSIQPLFTCCIRSTGDVVPIEALPFTYGNLGTEPFATVWLRLVSAASAGELRTKASWWITRVTPNLCLPARSLAACRQKSH